MIAFKDRARELDNWLETAVEEIESRLIDLENVVALNPNRRLSKKVCDRCGEEEKKMQFWSKQKPKKDGWYWWRKSKRCDKYLWKVLFCEVEDGLDFCWEDGTSVYWPKLGWWAGPIPEPKE